MHSSVCKFSFLFILLYLIVSSSGSSRKIPRERRKLLAIETTFKLPSPLPNWPPGGGFASGTIDLGGLQVSQVSRFNKIWSTQEGGPNNLGATFYEPASIPEGFSVLGSYSQPNNIPLFGHILVGKDVSNNDPSNAILKPPIDYTLVWSSVTLNFKKDGEGYFWLPTPPDGYAAVGYIVTNSSKKPLLDHTMCVRVDFTDSLEIDTWVWGFGKTLNVFGSKPTNRGVEAMGASIGGFVVKNGGGKNPLSISCLKNVKGDLSTIMPNLSQIDSLIQTYSPIIYFHPGEPYLPSSVEWFFQNGALLYHKGEGSNLSPNPSPIDKNGSNLPQGDPSDHINYWIDLPIDKASKERIKKGDLQNASAYFHVKPMFGGLFTDIAIWFFHPFNGPARAKVDFINMPLGRIGEHVGDWEHVTLRVSNFNGELKNIYFSQHSWGKWVSASVLEYATGNKPVVYSSLHGHASYPKPAGLLLGPKGLNLGLREDTKKSNKVMDTGVRPMVVAAEYLGSAVVEPPWLNYTRKWGPRVDYDIDKEINKVDKIMTGKFKTSFEKIVKSVPKEVLGQEGPMGPKVKASWKGDESVRQ